MTNLEIDNAYFGSSQADRIYLGQDLIWQQGPSHILTASTSSIYEPSGSGGTFNVTITASTSWTASYQGTAWNWCTFTPTGATSGVTVMQITLGQGGEFGKDGELVITDADGYDFTIDLDQAPYHEPEADGGDFD